MAILPFPINVPAHDDGGARFGLATNTLIFGGAGIATSERTEALGGDKWVLRAAWSDLTDDEAAPLKSFLTRLGGPAGRFTWGDPDYLVRGPRGTPTGTPKIKGAAQTGAAVVIDGWTPSTLVLREDDYVSWWIGPAFQDGSSLELHKVIADATSSAGGEATVNIAPPLRVSPADTTAVDVAKAACLLRLLDDDQIGWTSRTAARRPSDPVKLLWSLEFQAIQTFI